jgi:hypothetical protein
MSAAPQLLLVAAVAGVGVLHTIVPDHWVPITLLARQRGWSRAETARAAFQAGIGHVLSTLAIAAIVWLAGAAIAERFGRIVDMAASLALIGFGGWIMIASWRDLRRQNGHGHGHSHGHGHGHFHHHDFSRDAIHGPERQRIATAEGPLDLSIFEAGVPPRFRITGVDAATVTVQTRRDTGECQDFLFANHGTYWESVEEIPEPHGFAVEVTLDHGGHAHRYHALFSEHAHGPGDHDHDQAPEDDRLYAPLRGETALLTRHAHRHRHSQGAVHVHWHDHTSSSAHPMDAAIDEAPPVHEHRHKTTARTALLLILGSSPMVEGIPAFFAAGKYGAGLILVMAALFAASTIATYVLLCVLSTAGLQRVQLGAVERYGEVLSGAFIALIGLVFWIWPVL